VSGHSFDSAGRYSFAAPVVVAAVAVAVVAAVASQLVLTLFQVSIRLI
jgi:hypothetical protein